MNRSVTIGLSAAAVVAVLLVGCSVGGSGSPASSEEVPDSTPTPDTLASGSFQASLGSWGEAFDIQATGTGDDVSGTLEVTHPEAGDFAVELQCSRTSDDDLLVIGGEVTESTNANISEGVYVAILLAPGTPARTLLWLDDVPPADSCPAFLETMFSAPDFLELNVDELVPIDGDLELGS